MIKGSQSFSTDFNDSYQFRIVTPGCRLFEATVVRKLTLRFGTSLGWDLFNIANIFPIIKIFSLNFENHLYMQCFVITEELQAMEYFKGSTCSLG